jgi:hypothetical protein
MNDTGAAGTTALDGHVPDRARPGVRHLRWRPVTLRAERLVHLRCHLDELDVLT